MACGPLCSAFMMIITLWGLIFLGIVGVLFQQESVGLMADLPGEDAKNSVEVTTPAPQPGVTTESPEGQWEHHGRGELKDKYKKNAMNCWIAAGAHGVTFVLAFGRFMMVKNRL